MKARLRDFIITRDDRVYSVISYNTRENIPAALRYVPDDQGERIHEDGMRFRKIQEVLVEFVSWDDVASVLRCEEILRELVDIHPKIGGIVDVLLDVGVHMNMIGITGSYLCGLSTPSSDIDLVVYGNEWYRARDAVENAKKQGAIQRLSDEMWHRIYAKRSPEIGFDEFLVHELRKGHRGMVDDVYFDLLYTRDWSEIDASMRLRGATVRRMQINAHVTDDRFSFDNPAVYEVEHEQVHKVLSFTHTYAGQAIKGEMIEACGLLEAAGDEMRLVVGTSGREAPGEWIRSLTLLEEAQEM